MLNINGFCKEYFSGFSEIRNYKKNNSKVNRIAALKLLSYPTLLMPLGIALLYGISTLIGKIRSSFKEDSKVKTVSQQVLNKTPVAKPNQNFIVLKEVHNKTYALSDLEFINTTEGSRHKLCLNIPPCKNRPAKSLMFYYRNDEHYFFEFNSKGFLQITFTSLRPLSLIKQRTPHSS